MYVTGLSGGYKEERRDMDSQGSNIQNMLSKCKVNMDFVDNFFNWIYVFICDQAYKQGLFIVDCVLLKSHFTGHILSPGDFYW